MSVVFRSGEQAPDWCGISGFQVLELSEESRPIVGSGEMQRLVVTRGYCRLKSSKGSQVYFEGQFCDLDEVDEPFSADDGGHSGQIVLFSGKWGQELGGCGVFNVTPGTPTATRGDPVTYKKSTTFDSHYHDCDEYWVIIEGAGRVVVGSRSFEVKAGDCVAIPMGVHHDIPEVSTNMKGAWFETALHGKKRLGHLWNHKHGRTEGHENRL